ncbi:MAG: hypothetical protein WD690_04005 [Vicinamibacterales bacterium]
MSIYVRPVREQIEHDRVIRHLQIKLKRKYDVTMNVGTEQTAASVKAGTQVLYPDLVLLTTDKSRKLAGVVEVETGESVHHLEAMAEWAQFGRLKVPFQLYVPAASADMARRLASDLGAHITELWTYHAIGDQIRLTLVQKSPVPGEARRKADRERAAEKRAAAPKKPAAKASARVVKTMAKSAKMAKGARAVGKTAKPGKTKSRGAKPARKSAAARKPARATAKRK